MPVTWSSENKIPAAAITFVGTGKAKDNLEANGLNPIIFVNQRLNPCEGQYGIDPNNHWIIKSVDVRIQTDWMVANAQIVLVPSNPNLGLLPLLPDVSSLRGGKKKTLDKDDEIRIFLGWIQNTEEKITKDSLTDSPVNILDSKLFPESFINKIKEKISNNDSSGSSKLSPVFWGFIDKLELVDRGTGPQLIISCRDRMRVLADTRMLSIPTVEAQITIDEDNSIQVLTEDGSSQEGERDYLIFNIIKAINFLGLDQKEAWRQFLRGITARKYEYDSEGNRIELETPNISTELLDAGSILDQSLWNRIAQFLPVESNFNPRVHIWAERPPLIGGVKSATLQVLNKTPLEILDHLALQEELPIDFRVSPFNGDFIFGPRAIDFTGFSDPTRYYRSYFYKSHPPDLKPCFNQKCLSIEVVSTSYGTYNQFIILDDNTNAADKSLASSIQLSIRVDDYSSQEREIKPPNRTQIISDGSISSYPDVYQAAMIVGLNAARRFSRDTEGIEIKIIGDPTFYINEAFTVYNTVLHDYNSVRIFDPTKHDNALRETRDKFKDLSPIVKQISDQVQAGNFVRSDRGDEEMSTFNSPNSETGQETPDISQAKYPIYRAVNIAHTLNELSFTTTVIGVSDY